MITATTNGHDRRFDLHSLLRRAQGSLSALDVDAHEVASRLISDLEQFGHTPDPADTFKFYTSAELDSMTFEIVELVKGVIVQGQPATVCGGAKAGKTSISVDLAISMNSARQFLGKFWVPRPLRVAMLSGESGMAVIKETARRICRSKGLKLNELDGMYWTEKLPNLGRTHGIHNLRSWLTDVGAEVVIIDPLYLALDGAAEVASSLYGMGQLFRPTAEMCQEIGCTPILVHHTKKTTNRPKYDPPELEDQHGAGAVEFFRQWILVGRREPYAEGTGSHALWLRIGGSAGHSSFHALDIEEGTNSAVEGREWDVSIRPGTEVLEGLRETLKANKQAKKDAKDKDARVEAVRMVFRKEKRGLTANRLADMAKGVSSRTIDGVLKHMEETGEVERCKVQVSNRKELSDGWSWKGVPVEAEPESEHDLEGEFTIDW